MSNSKNPELKDSPKIDYPLNKLNPSSDPNFDNIVKIMDLYYIGRTAENSINKQTLKNLLKNQGNSKDESDYDAVIEFHSKIFKNNSDLKFNNFRTLISAATTEIINYINQSEKNAVKNYSYKKIFDLVQQISTSNVFNELKSSNEETKDFGDQSMHTNFSSDSGVGQHSYQVHHVTIKSPEFIPAAFDPEHLSYIKLDEEGFIEVQPRYLLTKKNKINSTAPTLDKNLKGTQTTEKKSSKPFKQKKYSEKEENPKNSQKVVQKAGESKNQKKDAEVKDSEPVSKTPQESKAKHHNPGHSYVTKEFVKKELTEEVVKQI